MIMRFFVLSICFPSPSSIFIPIALAHSLSLPLIGLPHFRSISNANCSAPSPFWISISPWEETRNRAGSQMCKRKLE